jgi:hypothetical protein
MPVSFEQVRAVLVPDEPNYPSAARLGPDALPHLEALAKGENPGLASKAVYLASLIPDERSPRILQDAAQSNRLEVRVAAAAGARNLSPATASAVLLPALDDPDIGVRKVALKSVSSEPGTPPLLRSKIQALTTTDPDRTIRDLASQALRRMKP